MSARVPGSPRGARSPRRHLRARLVPLSRQFFARHTLRVARDLLGHFLVHDTPQGRVVGRIVEVEAYRGPTDPASHAFRRTPRSQIMWGRPGTAYVYFTYGNHFCMNVVTEPQGRAGAVLLRAVEPLDGTEIMRKNRGVHDDRLLASGPGRLTQAFGVSRTHNGADLARPPLYLARGRTARVRVRTGPRIGIRVAVARPWRYYIPDHPCLSR
ncbi:MAG TPA: DNA-3-methyladenine glycosylase [bacterium]|nr:DNA-3-methyladenine glycosylase [bacterium]